MSIVDFFNEHTFLAFCALCFAGSLCSRLLRTIKVLARGWPPPHLDVDGDWRPEPEEA